MPGPSRSFYANLLTEEFSNVAGINEILSEKKLMGGSRGAHTDFASGVTFKNGNVDTMGIGWGRMSFSFNAHSGLGRGLGMFQLSEDLTKLFTSWGALYSAANADPKMNKVYKGGDFSNPSTPLSIGSNSNVNFCGLLSKQGINGWYLVADGQNFQRTRYNSGSFDLYAALYQPSTPAITDDSTAGVLDHYFAWCCTLVDSSGNESLPSALVASGDLSSKQVEITLTITNGASIGAGGYTKARLYRTLVNASAAVTAADNPLFYFVDELDLSTSGSDLVAVFTDNNSDTTLTSPNNYTMRNVIYSDGALTSLPTTMVPKFLGSDFGLPIGANWLDTSSGDTFPRRIYWGFNSDNSQNSPGNNGTWSSENYEDLGTDPSEEIIGIRGGLQGLFFIFLKNSTYIMQATGSSLLPYSFTKVSQDYGMYHHSVADCGSFVIGRTPKGFVKFNGATYTPLSENIQRTVSRCLYPDGDSGVYDPDTQRYMVVVCDSGITGSFLYSAQGLGTHSTVFTKNIVTAPRNKLLVYNVREMTWEDHGHTGIQFFCLFLDSSGVAKIFAQGMTSDLFFISASGPICGASYTELCTVTTAGNKFDLTNDGTVLVGRQLFVPYFTNGGLFFSDFQSEITGVDGGDASIVVTDGYLTSAVTGGSSVMVCIANNTGTITKTSSSTIEDTANLFALLGFNYYGIVNLDPDTLAIENNGFLNNGVYVYQGADLNNMYLVDSATSNMYSVLLGQIYSVLPFRMMAFMTAGFYQYPVWVDYMLPPFGYLQPHDVATKTFQTLELYIRGAGELLVECFLDGSWNPMISNPTPDAYKVITLEASDNLARLQVDLPNLVGKMLRIRLRCLRGRTQYTLNQARVTYRTMEAFGGK